MLDAVTTLKATGWYMFAMSVGMMFFTDKMCDMYQVGEIDAGTKIMMKGLGLQMMGAVGANMLTARVNVERVTSLTCFANVIGFALFAVLGLVSDVPFAAKIGMPKEGVYANVAIWSAIAFLNFNAWKATGSAKFELRSFSNMSKMATANRVHNAIGLMFVAGLLFNKQQMFDTYLKGVEVAPTARIFMEQMMQGMGITMLGNAIRSEMILSGDDEECDYALTRWHSMWWMVNMGQTCLQPLLNDQIGWPNDMHTFNVVMAVGMAYYLSNTFVNEDRV